MKDIAPPGTPDCRLNPKLSYFCTKTKVEFSGSYSLQDKITCNYGKIVNIYIVYEISKNYDICSYPTLENCLFGAVTLTKNADSDKYKYSEYGIGFDRKDSQKERTWYFFLIDFFQ